MAKIAVGSEISRRFKLTLPQKKKLVFFLAVTAENCCSINVKIFLLFWSSLRFWEKFKFNFLVTKIQMQN